MIQSQLHELVWQRFIRMPYGHLLDYANEQGETSIPTPEECKACDPNPLGWWTPIENGAFFGGLYLYALLQEHRLAPSDALAQQVQLLAKGLVLLKDVGSVDGFIARGVATDGVSHYPCSSEDQVVPWIFGLDSYMRSALCTDKQAIRARLLQTLQGLKAHRWSIPSDLPYACLCNRWEQAADWRGVCKLLFCAHLFYELTGDKNDLQHYLELRDGTPEGSVYTRWQIASHGFAHDMVRSTSLIQFWIDVCAHLCLRYLSGVDSERSDDYRHGCAANGVTVLPFLDDIEKYDNVSGAFSLDWRVVQPLYRPFKGDLTAAIQNANEESALWNKQAVPHRHMEHTVLGNALFGAWIALTCGDETIAQQTARILVEKIPKVDWFTLTISYAFVAESCLIFCGMLFSKYAPTLVADGRERI